MSKPLSAVAVNALTGRGCHRVSSNLYLQIGADDTRAWICRYQLDGKPRHMGLGSAKWIPLAQARQKAADAMRLVVEGIDPIAERKRSRQARLAETANTKTFGDCAAAYIGAHEAGWGRASVEQWTQSLRDHAAALTAMNVG